MKYGSLLLGSTAQLQACCSDFLYQFCDFQYSNISLKSIKHRKVYCIHLPYIGAKDAFNLSLLDFFYFYFQCIIEPLDKVINLLHNNMLTKILSDKLYNITATVCMLENIWTYHFSICMCRPKGRIEILAQNCVALSPKSPKSLKILNWPSWSEYFIGFQLEIIFLQLFSLLERRKLFLVTFWN